MRFSILRSRSDIEVSGRIGPAHDIVIHEIDRWTIGEKPFAETAGLIALPKAVRQLRTSHETSASEWLRAVQAATQPGVGLINLVNRSVAQSSSDGQGAYTLTSDLRVPVMDLPRPVTDQTHSRLLIEPLDRYLKRHSTFSMLTLDLRQFLPLECRDQTVALRTPIHVGGPEILLPVGHRLPAESLLDLIDVLLYYQNQSRNPANSHWSDRYKFYRNGSDLGMFSSHERDHMVQEPGLCLDYLLDVSGQCFYRRISRDDFEGVHLASGQLMVTLGLFVRPYTRLPADLECARYRRPDGTPFPFKNWNTIRSLRNAAVRLINKLEPLIHGGKELRNLEFCFDPGGRAFGLLIPSRCLGNA